MTEVFKNKIILVTGGTGSIGSEIVKQLIAYEPRKIRVFARGEMGHYRLQQILGQNHPMVRHIVGDVRDKKRLSLAMEGVDIVFHAAALKHVDICEDNPFEAVNTNIIGTQNVIELARENNLEKVIAISTDKAVSPEGILGTSKLMAEKLILSSYFYQGEKRTQFACVRFGNVLGSSGSVLQTIQRQVAEQSFITITNPEMTRFVMTVPQAVSLVLRAAELMKGQEIFVLKMPAVKIGDLIRAAVHYYTALVGKIASQIEIRTVGYRSGEKKHE